MKKDIIERLKKYQKRTGKSQAQLARELGTWPETVTRWFRGKHKPKHMTAMFIDTYLKVKDDD